MHHDETNQSSLPQDEYDAWLRAKILRALRDPRPLIPHEQVVASVTAKVDAIARRKSGDKKWEDTHRLAKLLQQACRWIFLGCTRLKIPNHTRHRSVLGHCHHGRQRHALLPGLGDKSRP